MAASSIIDSTSTVCETAESMLLDSVLVDIALVDSVLVDTVLVDSALVVADGVVVDSVQAEIVFLSSSARLLAAREAFLCCRAT